MNKYASRLVLFLMILLALPGLLFVLGFGYLLVASWGNSLTPEESVRLARQKMERRLNETNEQEKMQYAICKYYSATPEEPDDEVGCKVDIAGSDEIIYLSAVLEATGRLRYWSFERVKR